MVVLLPDYWADYPRFLRKRRFRPPRPTFALIPLTSRETTEALCPNRSTRDTAVSQPLTIYVSEHGLTVFCYVVPTVPGLGNIRLVPDEQQCWPIGSRGGCTVRHIS